MIWFSPQGKPTSGIEGQIRGANGYGFELSMDGG
jgi:hypothetical protein